MQRLVIKILVKLGLVKFFNFTASIQLNNKLVKVPVDGGVGTDNFEMSETWMVTVLKRMDIPLNGTFVDIGVNIGQTLIKIKCVYNDADYIGFEPNADCVSYTKKLIKANDWKNTEIIPVGIADKTSLIKLNFYSEKSTDSTASMLEGFRKGVVRSFFCPFFGYSAVEKIFENKHISLVKVDVEGAELEVLKSMTPIINKCRPFIILEVLPSYNIDNVFRIDRQNEIEKIIDDLKYFKYRIYKDEHGEFDRLQAVSTLGVHDRLDWCDYLFSPILMKDGWS